jgi:predicted nucleotidyltransferase
MEDRRSVILEVVHGSRAYGLATDASDTDVKGIFVAGRVAVLGYRGGPSQIEPSPERVLYEIRRFFTLAAACNPTVIELLFTDERDRLLVTPEGERLLAARDAFLSRRAGDSFGRYGLSQLRRIKTHRRWLLHPPAGRPARADHGLPDRTVVSRDQLGAAEALLGTRRIAGSDLSPNFLAIIERERRYRAALREWQQYQEWLAHRNPARAELERRFGYDTKHALHLLRLLRMAVEILGTGRVHVRRPDAEELLAVRRGALAFEELLEQAERLGARLEELAAGSPLPERPDETRLDALCAELIETAHAHARTVPASPPGGPEKSSRGATIPVPATAATPEGEQDGDGTGRGAGLLPDIGRARRFLAARGEAGVLVLAVTGAHAYGFASPDSDLDLKGIHVASTESMLSLDPPPDTLEHTGCFEGQEVDYTSHEVGFALRLLLKGNGNMLERLLSSYQLCLSADQAALVALARCAISRRFHRHYRGFFARRRRGLPPGTEASAKDLLYVYRSALTGIHLMRTGAFLLDVTALATLYGFDRVAGLVRIKREGSEHGAVAPIEPSLGDFERLEALLSESLRDSPLPESPPAAADLSRYLLDLRRRRLVPHAGSAGASPS